MCKKSFFQKIWRKHSNETPEVILIKNDIQGSINYCYLKLRELNNSVFLTEEDVAKALWMNKGELYSIIDMINFEIEYNHFVLLNVSKYAKVPAEIINKSKSFTKGGSTKSTEHDLYIFDERSLLNLYLYLVGHVNDDPKIMLLNINRCKVAYFLKELVRLNNLYIKSTK